MVSGGDGLALIAYVAGLLLGFVLPLRLARHRPEFRPAVEAAGLIAVHTWPFAGLAAYWITGLVGKDLGWPAGAFLGALGWAAACNLVAGGLAIWKARPARR
jgi:hypothetical protein